jgi:predicted amidophosphoribosyltransferase
MSICSSCAVDIEDQTGLHIAEQQSLCPDCEADYDRWVERTRAEVLKHSVCECCDGELKDKTARYCPECIAAMDAYDRASQLEDTARKTLTKYLRGEETYPCYKEACEQAGWSDEEIEKAIDPDVPVD